MPIVIVLITAALLYIVQERVYRRFWADNLHTQVVFTDRFIHEGQKTEIVETLSNGKILPLPWVYVKFRVDCNQKAFQYRSDLFSIRFYQQIRRRIPFEPDRRGIYTVHGIDLISNNLFITSKYVKQIPDTEMMTVYPKLVSTDEFNIPFQRMMGDIVTRRFMLEDPFLFKGIREYQPYDGMKNINYKASARAGKWLVNMFDYTVSQKVTILLNMDRANQYYDMRLYENSIRMAASLTAAFEQEAIPVELISNGKDVFTGEPVKVESGCGTGHMHTLFESLARLEITAEVEDLSPELEKAAEDLDADHMFLVISPFFGPGFVTAYEKLSAVHPSTEWILPVVLSDLNDPMFHGPAIADAHRNVFIWKVDAA
jgi:hypothetical protein